MYYLKIINTFSEIIYASWSKLSNELKSGIETLVVQAVVNFMDQNSLNIVLINNSRTASPAYILMLSFEWIRKFKDHAMSYIEMLAI